MDWLEAKRVVTKKYPDARVEHLEFGKREAIILTEEIETRRVKVAVGGGETEEMAWLKAAEIIALTRENGEPSDGDTPSTDEVGYDKATAWDGWEDKRSAYYYVDGVLPNGDHVMIADNIPTLNLAERIARVPQMEAERKGFVALVENMRSLVRDLVAKGIVEDAAVEDAMCQLDDAMKALN